MSTGSKGTDGEQTYKVVRQRLPDQGRKPGIAGASNSRISLVKTGRSIALAAKVLVITAGPGVGKTTLANSLLKILLAKAVVIALFRATVWSTSTRARGQNFLSW